MTMEAWVVANAIITHGPVFACIEVSAAHAKAREVDAEIARVTQSRDDLVRQVAALRRATSTPVEQTAALAPKDALQQARAERDALREAVVKCNCWFTPSGCTNESCVPCVERLREALTRMGETEVTT